MLRPRKPLIVFTPKSLLRTKESFATAEVLVNGRFEPILEDGVASNGARRIVLCSGKVYHDLAKHRAAVEANDVALVRVAQLYPVEENRLSEVAERSPGAELVWCQEEPENMGAYRFLAPHLGEIFGRDPVYSGRSAAASPASGSNKVHHQEQEALIKKAIEG